MARTRNSRIKRILSFAILPLCLSMNSLPVFGAGLEIPDTGDDRVFQRTEERAEEQETSTSENGREAQGKENKSEAASDEATGYGGDSDSGSYDENGVTKVMEVAAELKAEEERVNNLKAGSDYIPDQGVFLADSREEAEKVAKEYGAELISFSYGVGVLDLGRDIDEALSDTAAKLSTATPICHNSLCSICEETSNDPFLEKGSSFFQWQHEKIETLKAQEIASGNGITVAIIDTGMNSSHTELKDRTVSMVAVPYTDRNRITTAEDQQGHGSHCAGIVAAEKNNGIQGMGVAPGAGIYAVKVTNGRTMPLSDVIIGVQMAVEKKVQVISI
ncbi:MAG: S8 family serine peptidase, partial [Lachnospiraceae bacterium]|nr:S8 family serine peptidase [Lachnospiraceae bacterium]